MATMKIKSYRNILTENTEHVEDWFDQFSYHLEEEGIQEIVLTEEPPPTAEQQQQAQARNQKRVVHL